VIVDLQDVTKEFRSSGQLVTALDRVTLRFTDGETVAIVGESGSGKTTLARLLVGLEQTTEGEVRIDGKTVRKPSHVAGRIQMVFQDPFASFNPRHTVGYSISKALGIQLRCSPAIAVERSTEALEEVGLHPGDDFMRRMPDELSGGQRQRASIARALGGGAKLIVADEPTSMLDVSVSSHVLQLFRRLMSHGVRYVFITHNLAVARYIADRVVVLYRGVVVEDGPAEDVVSNPLHPYTQLLVSSTPDPARGIRPRTTPLTREESMTSDDFPDRDRGCVFASRCPHRSERCLAPVALADRQGTRRVRCVLHDGSND